MYSLGVFIGNQVGVHALLSTIMPLVTFFSPRIFPLWGSLRVITVSLSTTWLNTPQTLPQDGAYKWARMANEVTREPIP
jgi:hypothetical protein